MTLSPESRCAICGHLKATTVPDSLCAIHAEAVYQVILGSNTSRIAVNTRRRLLRREIMHAQRQARRYGQR